MGAVGAVGMVGAVGGASRTARAMMGGASRMGDDGSGEVKVWGNSYLLALTF